ncbi:uncharacterized protein [Coffea arabica]|uniref:Reverse transcriptase domain-containing protein n=1 Tax=Coffea arabica TaxID=13443 RepID=A0ABM4U472_COFAR
MAAPPSSSGEGSPCPVGIGRSFADVVASKSGVGFQEKSFALLPSSMASRVKAVVSTHRGEPAVTFDMVDIERVATPFQFAHVLIRLTTEADYYRIWARGIWYFKEVPMRVFKWSIDFHVDRETSVVPVWFALPKLPVHLFHKECLFPIVACLGQPLCVDAATAQGTRPNMARVCVEVDLMKELPSRVWISFGERLGFWQPLVPENLPRYCGHCFHQGHNDAECRLKHPELKPEPSRGGKSRGMQRFQPRELLASGRETAMVSGADKERTGGGPLLAVGHEVGAVALEVPLVHRQVAGLEGPVDGFTVERQQAQGEIADFAAAHGSGGVEVLPAQQAEEVFVHGDGVGTAGQVQEVGEAEGGEQTLAAAAELVEHTVGAAADKIIADLAERVATEAADGEEEGSLAHAGLLTRASSDVPSGDLSLLDDDGQQGTGTETHRLAMTLNLGQVAVLEQGGRKAKGRGIRVAAPSDRELRLLLVGVCEPKLSKCEADSIRQKLNFDYVVCNASGELWVFFSSPVGGQCMRDERQRLWEGLLQDKPGQGPWCVVGDFNLIISGSEKKGGRQFRLAEGLELSQFMNEEGYLMQVSQVFGDVFENVRKGEAAVAEAEMRVQVDFSDEAHLELQQVQANLNRQSAIEEQFWSQKARVKWLQHGDRNSRYFHSVVKQRRFQSRIHKIQDSEGGWVMDDEGIGREAVRFFSNLFSADPVADFHLLDVIPNLGDEINNTRLEEVPSLEEVKGVVFGMDGDSTAGPDGFSGKFFTVAWEVVAHDVYKAVVSFFCGAELPRFITATSIVLLPKVMNPKDFTQFRPISVSNFLNKVISRILVARLSSVLPRIISTQQSGFVKGQSIADNYLLAQELMSDMGRKCRGGNLALKLDMAKAYDRVSWPFLIAVLRRFGFGERFIDMV